MNISRFGVPCDPMVPLLSTPVDPEERGTIHQVADFLSAKEQGQREHNATLSVPRQPDKINAEPNTPDDPEGTARAKRGRVPGCSCQDIIATYCKKTRARVQQALKGFFSTVWSMLSENRKCTLPLTRLREDTTPAQSAHGKSEGVCAEMDDAEALSAIPNICSRAVSTTSSGDEVSRKSQGSS
jgi:hypothetical protein